MKKKTVEGYLGLVTRALLSEAFEVNSEKEQRMNDVVICLGTDRLDEADADFFLPAMVKKILDTHASGAGILNMDLDAFTDKEAKQALALASCDSPAQFADLVMDYTNISNRVVDLFGEDYNAFVDYADAYIAKRIEQGETETAIGDITKNYIKANPWTKG